MQGGPGISVQAPWNDRRVKMSWSFLPVQPLPPWRPVPARGLPPMELRRVYAGMRIECRSSSPGKATCSSRRWPVHTCGLEGVVSFVHSRFVPRSTCRGSGSVLPWELESRTLEKDSGWWTVLFASPLETRGVRYEQQGRGRSCSFPFECSRMMMEPGLVSLKWRCSGDRPPVGSHDCD